MSETIPLEILEVLDGLSNLCTEAFPKKLDGVFQVVMGLLQLGKLVVDALVQVACTALPSQVLALFLDDSRLHHALVEEALVKDAWCRSRSWSCEGLRCQTRPALSAWNALTAFLNDSMSI